ncbi:hypothetical protein D9613_010688 [Agrocybe pediades]|uniref:RING-type domain-containing protein n=1 Tax=Agrocybe pediades TaxID=84607 RepID=A0A8H4QG79_9AGAR|nr:hypothetical protein D9613_010688 [Agrocybe pediades]KAF9562076.1 hypothetical protein CPC08DRAFT_634593 [Agrocybe pediades]
MLSLGPGSSCDVCYERFGKDSKAPMSVPCGHVFCRTCIDQLGQICALCRVPFRREKCIRLHVDIDEVVQECSEEELNRAQRLQASMCKIADTGITEKLLRELLQEAKEFLKPQPKHLHRDLRAFHKLLTYLCEIRASLKSQKPALASLHEEIQGLKQEKAYLLDKLATEKEQRKLERESSLAVETSLRNSYHDAIEVYQATIE